MKRNPICWVCGFEMPDRGIPMPTGLFKYHCKACGTFEISYEVLEDKLRAKPEVKLRLAHWIRKKQLDGDDPPQFKTEEDVQAILQTLPSYDPSEKPDVTLLSLSKLVQTPGEWYTLDAVYDYTIACASGVEEFRFYINSLAALGLLAKEEGSSRYLITVDGWQRIAELRAQPLSSRMGFVAMRFVPEMHQMYSAAIGPAITEAGYRPEISGNPQHNDRIDVRIMAQIKGARFVVADVTHENQGVYFEAGYAIGLGRPVIWTCAEEAKGKLHFDTRQYAHILWKDAADLKQQLRDRIIATI